MTGWIPWVLFLGLAGLTAATAGGMLVTMSMYRAGLALMASFVALAGLFLLLNADLLAAIQVMMNVGGMLIMILFMVMLMIDPGGEMMWDMKRKMALPGPGAFSMSMPRAEPAAARAAAGPSAPTDAGPAPGARTPTWTCPMHPEVREGQPGACPICGMDLVPLAGPTVAPEPSANAEGAYTCPMHPEIRESQPGACPICGMDLVPLAGPTAVPEPPTAVPTAYTCPMHPEIRESQPGACPICGMDLVPLAGPTAVPEPPARAPTAYTCPMHPEIRESQPGACPICGMDLVPAPSTAATDGDAPREAGYTCPMHPEVRRAAPGACPKCGMALEPRGDVPAPVAVPPATPAPHTPPPGAGPGAAMGSMESHTTNMGPGQHYQMMSGMAMSTVQLPWALAIGAACAVALGLLILLTPWPTSPDAPTADATRAVGQLLLSRYMIGFEGAAFLILAGIVGAVVFATRERLAGPVVTPANQERAGQPTHGGPT